MATVFLRTLECDGCTAGLGHQVERDESNVSWGRRLAELAEGNGWTRVQVYVDHAFCERDLCPKCSVNPPKPIRAEMDALDALRKAK